VISCKLANEAQAEAYFNGSDFLASLLIRVMILAKHHFARLREIIHIPTMHASK
jgi:hypothetical protein